MRIFILALASILFIGCTDGSVHTTVKGERGVTSGLIACYSGGQVVLSQRGKGITRIFNNNEFSFTDESGNVITIYNMQCKIERK